MDIFVLILAGLIFGTIGGMGIGGGVVLIPFLTIFLGFSQQGAQAINLFAFIPMAIVALIVHIKNKMIDIKQCIFLVLAGVAFSFLGSYLASITENDLLKTIFGGFLIAVALLRGYQSIKKRIQKKLKL